MTKDSKYCLATAAVTGVNIFNVATGEKVKEVEVPGNQAFCTKLAFGDKLFFVMYKQERMCYLRFYNLDDVLKASDTPKVIKEIKSSGENIYTHALWGPLNKTIYTSTTNGKVLCIDYGSTKTLKEVQVHRAEIFQIQLTHDYTMLFTASKDGTAKLLNPETFEEIRSFSFTAGPCRAVAVSPLFDDQDIQKFHCVVGGGIDAREAAFTEASGGGGF